MKMFRKLVSVVAAATVLTSSLAFTFSAGAANIAPEEDAAVASAPNLQTNPQNGVILHAFNWSYNSIKDNLPAIKAAGYSTVQTSPVQQPKDYGAAASVGSEWWKPYQPVSHQIAQKSWYGTKADLTALCAEAEKYGIKIICDIVSNHVGNNDTDTKKDPFAVSPQVKTYQPNIYAASAKNSQFYHNVEGEVSDGDVRQCVQGHLTACPDLNTANSTVQNNIINLLKECIDCGVDGFRFDGAKHIETPSDGSYASQFWPNVTSAAKTYYKNKTGGDLYMYGEILNNCGPSSRQYSHYTPYIKVTDNRTGDAVTAAVKNKNAGQAASSSYKSNAGAGNIVLWTESHDTYEGEAGSAGISNTSSLTDDVITKSWALVAARKDSTALFFARPAAKMGQASSNTTYKSAAVSEVNKFKNAFVGQSEYLGSSGSIAYVRRGTTGIVLSNVGGAEGATANVNISGTGMANGSYVDTVTGNTFTVSNGTLSGTIGKSGVAVVYKSTSTPKATASKESGTFEGETLTVKLGLENAVSGTYALEDSAPVTFTGTPTIRIGSDYSYGDTITLNLTATDAAGQTESYVYKYKKTVHSGSGVYVFFNAAQKSTWKGPFSAYIYDEVTHASQNVTYSNAAGWPGEEMQYDEASGYYYVEVPSKAYKTTKNSDGTATVSSEPVDFNLGTSSNTYVIICGYLKSTGKEAQSSTQKGQKLNKTSQIYGTKWATTTLVPGGNVQATNVTKGAPAPTTVAPQPTTAAPQPTTQAQPVTTGGDKLTVNVKSNVIFGNRTETFDAGTKRITVAYYIKSNKLMVNDQWKLTWDPSVLKYCDEDGVNKKDLVIDGEVLGTTYYNTPITNQSVINGEKVGIGQLIGNVTNAGTYYPMRSLDTSGNGNIGILYATFDVIGSGSTDVNLDFVELQTKDGQIVQYSKMVEGAPDFPYTAQASAYEGNYDANYVNEDQPEPTTAAPQPTTAPVKPTDPQPTTPDPGKKYYYGDVNGDGICDIMDATLIQMYAAQKRDLDKFQLILGDVNGDGVVDVMDATLIQKYAAERTGTKKCGQEYNPPYVPTQPTEVQPTASGKGLTVTAKSTCLFDTRQETFSADTKQITVSFYVKSSELMVNDQWKITWDPSVLKYNEDQGVNKKDIVFDGEVLGTTFYNTPITDQSVINGAKVAQGQLIGNVTNAGTYYPMRDTDGDKIGLLTVTFDVIGSGSTEVNLDMVELQTKNGQVIMYSKFVDGKTFNGTTQTSIYAGKYNPDFVNPDTPQPTTEVQPVTQAQPTTEVQPVTQAQPTTEAQPVTDPEPTETDPVPTEYEEKTFLLTDNFGWGSAYVYAWDADGNAIGGEWPGSAQAETVTNGYGETQFICHVPEGAVGVILNNGNGAQTEDITDFNHTGYWMDGSKNDLNHYIVTPFDVDPTDPIPTDPTDPIPTEYEEKTFLLTDNFGWGSAYVYAWDADGNAIGGEWPGTAQAETTTNGYGETQFICHVPEGAAGVILNNGNGAQTEDITNFDVTGYWMDGTKNDLGYYVVTPFDGEIIPTDPIPTDPIPTDPIPAGSFLLTDNFGWGTAYVYAWDDEGNELYGAWPGAAQAETTTNGYGETQFICHVPEGATGVILNNGNGAQTENITNFDVTGYWMDGTKNDLGHYVVTPFDGEIIPTDPIPTDPIPTDPIPAGSFLLTDNFGWGTAYVYAWDDEGNELYGAWPGAAQAETTTNGYGETQFICHVPEGATGVILNNGNGAQTENITNFDVTGYWMDGTKNDLGHYVVTPFDGEIIPTDPIPTDPIPTDPIPAGSFLLTDNFGWGTAYVYAWDDEGNELYGAWPGAAQAETTTNGYGETQFICHVPEGATGVILNNGNGAQTENITNFDVTGYWMDGTKNDLGYYVVTPFDGEIIPTDPIPTDPIPTDPIPAGSFLLTDNFGWGTAYVYAWDADGNAINGEWPGAVQAETTTNDYGETQFICHVPEGAVGVVINNGNGAQTEDITDFTHAGYWMDGSKNGSGNFIVKAWD